MPGDLAEGRRLMDAAASDDPDVGLAAVVALRQLVEVLEELHVDRARRLGWSWRGAGRAAARRTLGIAAEQVGQRLEAGCGTGALRAAERRVRRGPGWRGGHPGPAPLCVHLLANRALAIAARFAAGRGDARIGPE